jgi:UDP-N-acetylmuramoyl-tripeptide--D-alanyl-D-alanine ligase
MQEHIQKLFLHFVKNKKVSTDTRKIEHGSIFFALKGPNFNGNLFAQEALDKGAAYVVVDENTNSDTTRTVRVEDALVALQNLSTTYRHTLKATIIAITGSNGKTTTKELVYRVLSQKYKSFATQGNLNNHIGVPLTLLSIPVDTEMVVLELGANHLGEIELLSQIAQPDYGIITNVGMDHLEGYGSLDNVAKGHDELFRHLFENDKNVFYHREDEQVSRMAARFVHPIPYPEEGLKISANKFYIQLCTISGKWINTQLPGVYNFPNIALALAVGKYFGVDEDTCIKAIEAYLPSNNRSQIVKTERNVLVMDAYNANPSSMQLAIENLANMETSNKVAILGDMFELGTFSQQEHLRMLELASEKGFRFVFACGHEFAIHRKDYPQVYFFAEREKLHEWLRENELSNSTILLKGSRGMALEKLVDVL